MEAKRHLLGHNLFLCAFFLAVTGTPFSVFPILLNLVRTIGWVVPGQYGTDKKAQEFTCAISDELSEGLQEEIRRSPCFSILIDESEDISQERNISGCVGAVFARARNVGSGREILAVQTLIKRFSLSIHLNLSFSQAIENRASTCST